MATRLIGLLAILFLFPTALIAGDPVPHGLSKKEAMRAAQTAGIEVPGLASLNGFRPLTLNVPPKLDRPLARAMTAVGIAMMEPTECGACYFRANGSISWTHPLVFGPGKVLEVTLQLNEGTCVRWSEEEVCTQFFPCLLGELGLLFDVNDTIGDIDIYWNGNYLTRIDNVGVHPIYWPTDTTVDGYRYNALACGGPNEKLTIVEVSTGQARDILLVCWPCPD